MSQVGGGKTGNRLRWSIPLPQSNFPVLIFTDVSGHCWIVFGQARATVMRATRNGVSPTMNYVTVEKSRQCHTSSTLVHWPSLTAVYWAYMKQMRLLSTGWQHMALNNNNIIGDTILPQTATKLMKMCCSESGGLLWCHLTPQRQPQYGCTLHNYSPSYTQKPQRYLGKFTSCKTFGVHTLVRSQLFLTTDAKFDNCYQCYIATCRKKFI